MLSPSMTINSKSETARANGAKSRGPITPEGKAKSSQNAIKHGLTATFTVLPCESKEDFEAVVEAHRAHHQPATQLEEELVRSLAIARWRLARIAAIETNLFDNELSRAEVEIDEEFSEITGMGKLAHVFGKLADKSKSLFLLIRYENSLTRTCDRAFKHLLAVQKLRNEPKPEPAPPSPQPPSGDPVSDKIQIDDHPSSLPAQRRVRPQRPRPRHGRLSRPLPPRRAGSRRVLGRRRHQGNSLV